MAYNYSYAELLGQEMLRQRRREAEKERLIRQVTRRDSAQAGRFRQAIRSRLNALRPLVLKKRGYIQISGVPKNSTSV